MSLICLNCRGLEYPWSVSSFRNFISSQSPTSIFFQETKLFSNELERTRVKFSIDAVIGVDCDSNSGFHRGGHALMWKDEVEVTLKSFSLHHIDIEVNFPNDVSSWHFNRIYGWPKGHLRWKTWDILRHLHSFSSLPCIVGGDLNEILYQDEKLGGNIRDFFKIQNFRDALDF
ncbi:conserved hypothetical protein [Ricinus communis]|uniref:Endonuclease/exonuclease/phosphatase domain-containing protein n=1 Tax=Ricinus communis TaxID=3988 RepID=B9SBQ3_RICCO|nr:conserved hypothetical protein [Ricinus communis]